MTEQAVAVYSYLISNLITLALPQRRMARGAGNDDVGMSIYGNILSLLVSLTVIKLKLYRRTLRFVISETHNSLKKALCKVRHIEGPGKTTTRTRLLLLLGRLEVP